MSIDYKDNQKTIPETKFRNRHRKAITPHKTDLNKIMKKLRTILERDVNHLMIRSDVSKLEENEASDVRGYIKLVKDLIKSEKDEKAKFSDEELEKMSED